MTTHQKTPEGQGVVLGVMFGGKRIRSDALRAFQIICTFAYSFINMQLYELQRSKYPL